jgi:hypothetical protein
MLLNCFAFVFCVMWAMAMTIASLVNADKEEAMDAFVSALVGWFATFATLYWLLQEIIEQIRV